MTIDDTPPTPSVTLTGRNVALRPVTPDAYDLLFAAEHSEQLGPRWRLQGNTVPPEDYARTLWTGVTAQFLVHERGAREPVGLVCLYNADHANQIGYFAVASLGADAGPTRVAQGAALFLGYVFATWSFRKVYVQAMEYNVLQYRSMCGRLLVEEGRLRAHHYLNGHYWDQVHYAIYRHAWDRWGPRLLAGVADPGERAELVGANGASGVRP